MKKVLSILIVFLMIISVVGSASSQINRKKTKKRATTKKNEILITTSDSSSVVVKNNDPIEDEKCWVDFVDPAAVFQAAFCGQPKMSFMKGDFRGKNILRTNFTAKTKNAYYLVGYYDWVENPADEKNLRKLFADLTKDYLERGAGTNRLVDSRDILINGKLANESIFVTNGLGTGKVRTIYADGKIYFVIFSHYFKVDDENRSLYKDSEDKFFNSFQITNSN